MLLTKMTILKKGVFYNADIDDEILKGLSYVNTNWKIF
jgi:hypothetical protein